MCMQSFAQKWKKKSKQIHSFQIIEAEFKICIDCNTFLTEVHQYTLQCRNVQNMFIEIDHQLSQQNLEQNFQVPECSEIAPRPSEIDITLSNVRHRYGLKPLEVQVEAIENLFDETNIIQGALEIKLESDVGDYEIMEDQLSVHSSDEEDEEDEDDEEEEEEEEEDESEIEELSDSQLRKHEESLELKDELSDGTQEERKRRKRKYRKSNEEKLFE